MTERYEGGNWKVSFSDSRHKDMGEVSGLEKAVITGR